MFDLLSDRLITVETTDGRVQANLPEVLEAMLDDRVVSFPALRPHQAPAWHMFLAQIGALAAHRHHRRELPREAATWSRVLLDLSGQTGEAWHLLVEDLDRPAFFQPAIAAEDRSDLKPQGRTPDQLDILVFAKNHTLKAGVLREATPEDWAFALLTAQTNHGYGGRTWNGAARMQSGYASRVTMGLRPDGGPGAHLRRDMEAMLEDRGRNAGTAYRDGAALVWLEPWSGESQLGVKSLDTWFVEICRKLRLRRSDDGRLEAVGAGTDKTRLNAKSFRGALDDPWAPVQLDARVNGQSVRQALLLGPEGWTAKLLCSILFPTSKLTFELPLASRPRDEETGLTMVFEALARGQCVTEGYHRREIPMQSDFVTIFSPEEEVRRNEAGVAARALLNDIEKVSTALLKACEAWARGGDLQEVRKSDMKAGAAFVAGFAAEMDRDFFDLLQERAGAGEEVADRQRRRMIEKAQGFLDRAMVALTCPSGRRGRALVAARDAFAAAWKILPRPPKRAGAPSAPSDAEPNAGARA